MRLLYFADPMCSWCYGFGPELERFTAAHPDAKLELVMGGLRPFNREPMSEAFRAMLREHWAHVASASGLPLNPATLRIEGFVYDTEPACRAVVTARGLDPSKAPGYFHAVQAAFYRDARDVTRAGVLVTLAGEAGYDEEAFAATLGSERAREDTRRDFETSQRLGVAGFPTLALAHGEELFLVTSGFVQAAVLEERVAEIGRRLREAAGGTAD